MPKSDDLAKRIRLLIERDGYTHSDRLPCERDLCERLDVSRYKLRNALIGLEKSGIIWRHVGRGTFVGARPILNLDDVSYLRDLVCPEQMVTVRLTLEPQIAGLAALNATPSDLEVMQNCTNNCREAPDWRGYEAWDNNLHHAIARACSNKLYQYFFETLNVLRHSVVWGQPRTTSRPARDHASFAQHEAIVAAIKEGDSELASQNMKRHLEVVYARMLPNLLTRPRRNSAGTHT